MHLTNLYNALRIRARRSDSAPPHVGDLFQPAPRETQLDECYSRLLAERDEQLKADNLPASKRDCPECNEPDVVLVLDGVEIDYCRRCQGIWLDTGELQHFTHLSREIPGQDLTSRPSRFNCPVCGQQMTEYQFHPRTNLMIDACSHHGIFLQDHEFRRALTASSQGDQ